MTKGEAAGKAFQGNFGLDPLSIAINTFTQIFASMFGIGQGPTASERAKMLRDYCSRPGADVDVCGPLPWGSTNCQGMGLAVADVNEFGVAIRCKCPIAALWGGAPQSGCGKLQAVKDNALIMAGAGALVIYALTR